MRPERTRQHRDENAARQAPLRKDVAQERVFERMNDSLASSHAEMTLDRTDVPAYPAVFLFGLPRSGTTLLLQLFTRRFDVGYVNNLIARFWRAPLYGIALSQALLKGSHDSYESYYGKTPELAAPHEFAYFWHYWFNIDVEDGIDVDRIRRSTDWEGLARTIANMAHWFARPIAFKGLWPAFLMAEMRAALPQSFFVYIKRDPEDVAVSLYKARMAYYGNPETWWSMYPPEYHELMHKDWSAQIAGQVYYLTRWYERQLDEQPSTSYRIIRYEDLCSSPHETMESLRESIRNDTGVSLETLADIPERFEVRRPERDFEGADALCASVRRLFAQGGSAR